MFYISRRYNNKVCVYDDTDGVEEEVSYKDIQTLVSMGVHIEGVDTKEDVIFDVFPVVYKPDPHSIKSSLFHGIIYQVSENGELIYLNIMNTKTVLRLSDICSTVGKYSFWFISDNSKVIFDDKIRSISRDAFVSLKNEFFKFDISELRDDLAYLVYEYGCHNVIYDGYMKVDPLRAYDRNIRDDIGRMRRFGSELSIFKYEAPPYIAMDRDAVNYVLSRHKDSLLSWIPTRDKARIRGVIDKSDIKYAKNQFNKWHKKYKGSDWSHSMVLATEINELLHKGIFIPDIKSNPRLRIVYIFMDSGGIDDDILSKFYEYLLGCEDIINKRLGI